VTVLATLCNQPRRPRERSSDAPLLLTENRREILLRLFAGEDLEEIAKATGRSRSTIANTLVTIRKRLGASTAYELVIAALSRGIVTLADIERHRKGGDEAEQR
jgi:DNA-binding NarL/FixJ family response regulator